MPTAAITITNNHGTLPVKVGRTFRLKFDHAALVTAKRSRPDGQDLRVQYGTSTLRVFVENPNTTTTAISWRCMAGVIAAASDNGYLLLFGNLGAGNQFPIPVLHTSNSHPHIGMLTSRGIPKEPYLFFDNFEYDFDGSAFNLYGSNDPVDAHMWGSIGSPTVRDKELIHNSAATVIANPVKDGSLWAAGESQRQICDVWIPTGVNTSVLDGLIFLQGLSPVNLLALTTAGYTVPILWAMVGGGGLVSLVNLPAVADMRDRWTRFSFGLDRDTNATTIRYSCDVDDGTSLGVFTDPVPSVTPGYPGTISNPNVGGLEVKYRNFKWETWDGIDEADLSMGVTIPAIAWPSDCTVGFPLQESVRQLSDVWAYPSAVAVKGAPRGEANDVGRWTLQMNNMRPDLFWELLALYKSTRSVSTFAWTPPGGSAGTYAMESVDTSRSTYGNKRMTVTLEKIV